VESVQAEVKTGLLRLDICPPDDRPAVDRCCEHFGAIRVSAKGCTPAHSPNPFAC